MNVHHLELFYYVAKHKGISAAVRKMPYGIQQPAMSGQLLQLEKELGAQLFHRRPFRLTPAGEELYDFAYPFFSRLERVEERIKQLDDHHLRLGSVAVVLGIHLPPLLEKLKQEVPDLRLTLRDVTSAQAETALLDEEIDMAIVSLPEKSAPGLTRELLVELPLVLYGPRDGAKRLEDLRPEEGTRVRAPLIAMPDREVIRQQWHEGLESLGLVWDHTVEVSTVGLIQAYVRLGYGYGLSVEVPGKSPPEDLQRLELPPEIPPL
ncbi:MAG: LysR family transcriptional regulator, partial [Verrucomicrobiota bacterium]